MGAAFEASDDPNLCKSRGIYGNYLGLPRLILPCGGTHAAIPHIPAAKLPPGAGRRLCGRLPVQSQYPVRIPCENAEGGKAKRATTAMASAYVRMKNLSMYHLTNRGRI